MADEDLRTTTRVANSMRRGTQPAAAEQYLHRRRQRTATEVGHDARWPSCVARAVRSLLDLGGIDVITSVSVGWRSCRHERPSWGLGGTEKQCRLMSVGPTDIKRECRQLRAAASPIPHRFVLFSLHHLPAVTRVPPTAGGPRCRAQALPPSTWAGRSPGCGAGHRLRRGCGGGRRGLLGSSGGESSQHAAIRSSNSARTSSGSPHTTSRKVSSSSTRYAGAIVSCIDVHQPVVLLPRSVVRR
jgi:hypothetical protein